VIAPDHPQAQANRLADAFHQHIEGPSLGVATPQLRHCGNIDAFLVAFDDYVKTACHGNLPSRFD
jgi:hypothetical protein